MTITAGEHHTCGITDTGDTYCWGYNGYGQLGRDSTGGNARSPWRVVTEG